MSTNLDAVAVTNMSNSGLKQSMWLYVLVFISLSLNVGLAIKVHNLRAPRIAEETTGVVLRQIPVRDITGAPSLLKFDNSAGKGTVIYVLSPSCHWCAQNVNNITSLAKERGSDYRFVGLSLNAPDLKAYTDSLALSFPVYSIQSWNDIKELTLGSTPQTIVVNTQGQVIKNWIGAYANDRQRDIENFFSVRLPGLIPEKE